MKRLLSLLFAITLLFTFVACTENNNEGDVTTATTDSNNPTPVSINVYTLNGTTGFGMAKLMEDSANGQITSEKYNFTVESDASKVLAALTSGTADIAALPTNAASTVFNKTKGGVKIIAINTLGCLFLLNTGDTTVSSIAQLGGKTVYAPAQNPTFILTYLCRENGLTVVDHPNPAANEVYIDSTSYALPANLRDAVASGSVELAVLPEPMVTIAVSKAKAAGKTVKVDVDLTAEWDKLPGKANTLVQGCVVVRKAFLEENPQAVENFLASYKTSIEYLNTNVEEAAALVAKHGIFENANVAKVAIPKCNVRYIDGADMKSAVSAYLQILSGINPTSIGGALPTEDFYYGKA